MLTAASCYCGCVPLQHAAEVRRLYTIYMNCAEQQHACMMALVNPSRSMLMPEFMELESALNVARAAFAKAQAAWSKYRANLG